MKKSSILVLSEPGEPQLSMLEELRDAAAVVIGNSADAFEKPAGNADVIFNWSGSLSLIRDVFLMSPHVRWVHSRSAGLERTLFPELIASDVIMTNGSGIFSPSLGEFALKGAALDVFDEEPLPSGHPFYKFENVLLSPHCADHTPDWLDNAMRFFLSQFETFRRGDPLLNVVDKKLGY